MHIDSLNYTGHYHLLWEDSGHILEQSDCLQLSGDDTQQKNDDSEIQRIIRCFCVNNHFLLRKHDQ